MPPRYLIVDRVTRKVLDPYLYPLRAAERIVEGCRRTGGPDVVMLRIA